MKSTIKLSKTKAVHVERAGSANLVFFTLPFVDTDGDALYMMLTPDQCGALIFGIEQALKEPSTAKAKLQQAAAAA